jgi:hypothetical protein
MITSLAATCLVLLSWALTAHSEASCVVRGTTELSKRLADEPASTLPRYDARTLETKLYAVHATRFFPEDGVMKAGASNARLGTVGDEPAAFRPTLHFSLGEMVRGHRDGSWEDAPYAVVTPLKTLKPQLVNVNPYDTFILGDFSLPPESIVVMPKGQTHRLLPGQRVFFYDPRTTTLREAVDAALEREGAWKISMDLPPGKHNGQIGSQPALLNGEDINSSDFFRPLLDESPHVSYGTHYAAETGTLGARAGTIENLLQHMMDRFDALWVNSVDMELGRELIVHHLAKMEIEIKQAKLPFASLDAFRRKKALLEDWLRLANQELDLQKTHGLSFAGLSRDSRERFKALRGKPKELEKYVNELREAGKLQRAESPSASDPYWYKDWAAMPAKEFAEFRARHAGLLKGLDPDVMTVQYAIDRLATVRVSAARKEGLDALLTKSIRSIGAKGDAKSKLEECFKPFVEYLDTGSNRLDDALAAFSIPAVKDAFRSGLMPQLPYSKNITLQDILKAHPDTRGLFDELPVPPPGTNSRLRILRRIQHSASGRPENMRSFSAAKVARVQRDIIMSQLEDRVNDLDDPLRAANPIYEEMQKGKWGRLEDIWASLGVAAARFRREYPTDASFWSSSDTFFGAYARLTGNTGR